MAGAETAEGCGRGEGACAGGRSKRPPSPSTVVGGRAVRLKWVAPAIEAACEATAGGRAEAGDRLVLESFEVVPAAASETAAPDPELAIAAASLLASITAGTCRHQWCAPADMVVTATVPLVDIAPAAFSREALKPILQPPKA